MQKHQARIYAICRRLAGNDADALDATQEALLAIVKGLERFDGRAAFTTWSYRVATNACLDELRRRSRRPQPGLPDHEGVADEALGRRPSLDPGEAVTARIDIDDALAQLPEEFKAPVVLRDLAGVGALSFKAVQTGENTARTMIQWPDAATAQAAVDGLRAAAMEMTDTKVVATAGGETKLDFS